MNRLLAAVVVFLFTLAPPLAAAAVTETNLALNKPATVTSAEKTSLAAYYAVDGKMNTRWSSDFTDHNWITVDLEGEYAITAVRLHWQNSYAKDYDVKVSLDGQNWTTVQSVQDSDGGLDEWALSTQARYVRIEGYRRATQWGQSLWELEVIGHEAVRNLSRGQPATASSTEKTTLKADFAVDGDTRTRWSSDFSDHNWIAVDLGDAYQITSVALQWQNSYAKEYEIQTSYDGVEWTTLKRVEDSNGGLEQWSLQGHGRYLRVEGFRRATQWGHSLWELDVFGYHSGQAEAPEIDVPPQIELPPETDVVSGAVYLQWYTPDQRENGAYLEFDEIGGYEIRYQKNGESIVTSLVLDDPELTEYELMLSEGHYTFSIAVFDTDGLYSRFTRIEPTY